MRLISGLVAPILLLLLAVVAPDPAVGQALPGLLGGEATPSDTATDDPVKLLLQILEDGPARARLVEQLKAAEGSGTANAATPAPGRRTVDFLAGLGESAVSTLRGIGTALVGTPDALSGIDSLAAKIILEAFGELFFVILASVGTFVVLRAIARPLFQRIGARVSLRPRTQRLLPFLGVALIDLAITLVAWIAGVLVALVMSGANELGGTQKLYVTAFFAVAIHRYVLRLLLAPATPSFRLLNLSDWAARRLYRIGSLLVILFGYGFLLILPLVSQSGFAEGQSTAVLIWLIAVACLGGIVLYYRHHVGEWLLVQWNSEAREAAQPETDDASHVGYDALVRPFAFAWYWVALAWLLWLLVTVLTQRPHIVTDLLVASAKVALAVVAGLVASGLLGRMIQWGILLPQQVSQRVPLLESRLNRHVPRMLFLVRLLILAGVVIYSFSTLDLVSARGWFESSFGLEFSGRVFSVALILLGAFVIWLALTSWVDYRLNPAYGRATAREQTLLTLLRNAGTIAVLTLALMFVLSEIGLNIGPLIASAGVVGLAIGFGAQKMVQDIITGIFIQFENAINVGDVVSAGGITGAVERLTVRSVSLRDLGGVYHIIPFSSVDVVSNFTRDFSFWVIDMGIAYREDMGAARQAIFDAFEEVRLHPEVGGFVLADLEWFGLDSFGDSAVMLKARIKTWPARQWAVGRAYNEILKRIFDERGIEIPFPQRTLWFGEDREGNAPPMRVAGAAVRAEPAPQPQPSGEAHVTGPTQDAPPDGDGD